MEFWLSIHAASSFSSETTSNVKLLLIFHLHLYSPQVFHYVSLTHSSGERAPIMPLLQSCLLPSEIGFAPRVARIPARSSPCADRARAVVCTSAPQQQATYAASLLGLASQPVFWWSLYTLKTTGCGLPAGPFGLIGAAEGISYLVIIGFVASSLLSKVTSGKGLPAGPSGLLGAAEGLSFLSAAAGLAVLGFQLSDYGYLPEAVPVAGGVCSNI